MRWFRIWNNIELKTANIAAVIGVVDIAEEDVEEGDVIVTLRK